MHAKPLLRLRVCLDQCHRLPHRTSVVRIFTLASNLARQTSLASLGLFSVPKTRRILNSPFLITSNKRGFDTKIKLQYIPFLNPIFLYFFWIPQNLSIMPQRKGKWHSFFSIPYLFLSRRAGPQDRSTAAPLAHRARECLGKHIAAVPGRRARGPCCIAASGKTERDGRERKERRWRENKRELLLTT